ncbi:MFS transporter [Flavobacterium aurantiibacter]|uniref:Major facilitator superfamily (MFS) profile domain-containing protein n=1 Tax=Flavobacterium aurantiibacter TaxID=2023067 RepID=A0A256A5F2_9FLAO|nr:MFS transporter [Flavobacterium aurantiibacter]OYQ49027.1 hypothetical protein CHX27_01745 [Flavobacterium aurantiibacter]
MKQSFFEKNPSLLLREFQIFLASRFGVVFSLNMQTTIIFYWIYELTKDKLTLGLIGLAEVIPAVGISFFSGYIVDHTEKRKMVLACILGYILVSVLLVGVAYFPFADRSLQVVCIFVLVFLGGVLRAFYSPSMFSLFGKIMPKSLYPNATSWSSMSWQLGAVIGPLTAGFSIALLGIENALIFIVAVQVVMLLVTMSIKPQAHEVLVKEPVLRSVREGLQFVFKTPVLFSALCLDLFSVLFGGAIALLPVYQKEILFISDMGYGILRAAPGIGALLTLGLLAFLPLKTKPGIKLFWCVGGFAVSIIIFGISKNFYLSLAMLVLSGMFDAVSVVIRSIILQLTTPDHMRGRVAAVNTMFVSSSNELGDFESGLMAHWLGTVRAVVVGGCITLGVVLFTFAKVPQLRNFKFEDDTDKKNREP